MKQASSLSIQFVSPKLWLLFLLCQHIGATFARNPIVLGKNGKYTTARRKLCLLPEDLAEDLAVQIQFSYLFLETSLRGNLL
jgi:hypothetical protein